MKIDYGVNIVPCYPFQMQLIRIPGFVCHLSLRLQLSAASGFPLHQFPLRQSHLPEIDSQLPVSLPPDFPVNTDDEHLTCCSDLHLYHMAGMDLMLLVC